MEYLSPLCISILEEVDSPIIIVDESLEVKYLNTASLILLKCSRSIAEGAKLSNLLFGETKMTEIHDGYMRKLLDDGVKPSYAMGDRLVSFRDRKLSITLHPLSSPAGHKMCLSVISDKTDVEEAKEKVATLEQTLQVVKAEKLSVEEQIVLKKNDLRGQIIESLVKLIAVCVIGTQIVTYFDKDKVSKSVEDLIPAIFSTLVLCIGFYFNKSDSKD